MAVDFAEAKVVFEGELVSATPAGKCGYEDLTFVAERVWKGGKKGPFVVRNHGVGRLKDGSPGGAKCTGPCPVRAALRRNYLVFAGGEDLSISFCTPFVEMSSPSDPELRRKLDALAKKGLK